MISHTRSLARFKDQISQVYDFFVLTCYAVPNLKLTIKRYERGNREYTIAKPDYFAGLDTFDQLKGKSRNYKSNLSKYVLISSFSFFEAYVISAIKEILEFHGGTHEFLQVANEKNLRSMNNQSESVLSNKRKLQEYSKKNLHKKYAKYSRLLHNENFRFPSDLMSSFGIKKLSETLDNMKSKDIPQVLRDGISFEMDASVEDNFHRIRNLRNNIAHGKAVDVSLKEVVIDIKFFRKLGINIDKHIVQHFFIIDRIY